MLASWPSALHVMAGAYALIPLLGTTQLALFLGVGPVAALTLGLVPFLAGDTLKVVAAAAIALNCSVWLRRQGQPQN
jgi:biotin transporter BioY